MPTVIESVKNQSAWGKRNTFVADEGISRGMGEQAKHLLQDLVRSAKGYYSSSEALLEYPPAFNAPSSVMDTSLIERITQKQLGGTFTELANLSNWDAGWDGYNAPKPDPRAIKHATQWIITFFQEVVDLGWTEPNVTVGLEGEAIFEWWYGQNKLTMYIRENGVEYVQVWGTDIDSKITDGDIESTDDYRSLWAWLMD